MGRKKVKPEDRKRFTPAERSEQILAAAVKWARADGLEALTLAGVGRLSGCTDGLVAKYFSRVSGLRDAVLAQAVVNSDADIVADAIEMGLNVHHVPPELVATAQAILVAHTAP